ncbi:MAG: PilN domain-containing protein [Pseudomonadota bacterium]
MHINFAEHKDLKSQLMEIVNIREFKLDRRMMLVIAGGCISLMLLFGIVQKLRLSLLQGDVVKNETLNYELKRKATESGIDVNKRGNKEDIFKDFDQRILWSKVLNTLSDNLPQRVWLNSLSATDGKNPKMKATGQTIDQSSLANLLDVLDKSPLFANVKLVKSDTVEKDGKVRLDYDIECSIKHLQNDSKTKPGV